MENNMNEKSKHCVGINLKNNSKSYDYDPNSIKLRVGDKCIVETNWGEDIGIAAISERSCCHKKKARHYKKVLRKATKEDLRKSEFNDQRTKEAFQFCLKKIEERKIPMKLFQVNMNLEATKAKFYFSAEGRVDFRVLIKDLAQKFNMKIEMRQIGVRDEAKLMGGCGPCGLKLCCSGFLKDFEPVSIRMAKNQNLALNPMKITGVCGRLLCCLIYENDTYKELKKNLPKNGVKVETPEGEGKVISIDTLQQKVFVEMEEGKRHSFSVNEIKTIGKNVKNLKNENKQGKNDKPT
tara:strand:+ start:4047 stop:4928 length:882 start_codon:yes stop_codon:yes gene_type:complete